MVSPEDQPTVDLESLSFEDAFNLLNQMAEQLEAGGLTLADAASRFEEGMRLVARCNSLLNTTELKITELRNSYRNGSDAPVPAQDLARELADELDSDELDSEE